MFRRKPKPVSYHAKKSLVGFVVGASLGGVGMSYGSREAHRAFTSRRVDTRLKY
jgi:hypothetical protein